MTLNRVLCAKIEDQAAVAVSLGDPWVLEEIYMRGAPVEVAGKSGYRPIHLAVQKNQFECIMVLIGIGVDINVVTVSGVTPLYMARASGAVQAAEVLIEKGAKLMIDPMRIAPGVTVLEVDKPVVIPDKVSKFVGLPTKNLWY
jgi:ankyrin repeat protein